MSTVRVVLPLIVVFSSWTAYGQNTALPPEAATPAQVLELSLKGLMTPAPRLLSALEQARQAVDQRRNTSGPDSAELIPLLIECAELESKTKGRARAVETHREVLRLAEKNFGGQDYRTRSARVEVQSAERIARLTDAQFLELQTARAKIISLHVAGARFSDSEKERLTAEAHEKMRELCGVGSHDCETAHKLRCTQALAARRLDEVVRLTTRDLDELKQKLGPDHPSYFKPLLMRSYVQVTLKDVRSAESGFREVDGLPMTALGVTVNDRCNTLTGLTSLLIQADRLEEAAETARRQVEIAERNAASDRLRLADSLDLKAKVALLQNKDDLAIQCLLPAIAIESSPEGRPLKLAALQMSLGSRYIKQQRWAEAEPLLRSCSQIFEKTAGPTDGRTLESACSLASVYLATERWEEAETLLKPIHLRSISRSGRDREASRQLRDLRVTALRGMKRYSAADELLREPRPFVVQPASGP